MIFFYRNIHLNQALYILQVRALVRIYKTPCYATVASPSSSSNSVNVGFGNVGDFKIDHMGELIDVNTASSNVCGDENTRLTRFKVFQGVLTRILAFVAMNSVGSNICSN